MPQQEVKYFLCYAGESEDLMDDFVEKFKAHFDCPKPLYDKTAHSGNMHKRFQKFANECHVAILMVNAKFTNFHSYANEYEVPILLERQLRGEVIVVGIIFQDAEIRDWNSQGNIYFFQLRNNELPFTRRDDGYGDKFNRRFAVYEQVKKEDKNTYVKELKLWVTELINDNPKIFTTNGKFEEENEYGEINELSSEEISTLLNHMEPSIRPIEKKLREMANHYFDKNGFKRPSNIKLSYVESYLTLQRVRLQRVSKELREIDSAQYNFVRPIKELIIEVKKCCLEIQQLLPDEYSDSSLSKSLKYSMLTSEEVEQKLFSLINTSDVNSKEIFKIDYLFPLIEQISSLQDDLKNFPSNPINPIDN